MFFSSKFLAMEENSDRRRNHSAPFSLRFSGLILKAKAEVLKLDSDQRQAVEIFGDSDD
jgi:hypothetical protein